MKNIMLKKLFLLPAVIAGFVFSGSAQVKTIKVPPNKDTVLITVTTETTVVPATASSSTVITSATIPTTPGPDPDPGNDKIIDLSFSRTAQYYERPFAGVENWQGQNYSPIGDGRRLDYYDRLSWSQLEGATIGNYTWARMDQAINNAIQNGQRYSFGIMTVVPGGADPFNGPVYYGGSSSLYPLYLHNLMQSETVKDRIMGVNSSTWVPNWNSSNYLNRLDSLHANIARHIATTSFNGVRYSDVVNYIDVRIMGSYGEWHHAGIVDNMNQYPAGMRPTVATYKRIIDSYVKYFPDNWLVMILAALDAERLAHTMTPLEVTNYALTVRNNAGPLGIRSDQRGSLQWNDQGNYVRQYMENNNKRYNNGPLFSTLTMSRWQVAPLVGEPENNNDNPQLQTLSAQFQMYRQNSIGNGNYRRSTAADNNMKNGAALAGYRLVLTTGKIAYNKNHINISLSWQNIGLTPNYENWQVVYQLQNSAGTVVWSGNSSFTPKLFLPQSSATAIAQDFNFSTSPAPGSYVLKMAVIDPKGYRQPLPLDINGRDSKGAYLLTPITF